MKYRFHPGAEAELNDAVDYYDECQEGLGLEFAREVYAAIESICEFPLAWASLSKNTRRRLLKALFMRGGLLFSPKVMR